MSDIKNPYRSIEAEVLEVISETPTIKTIRFQPKEALDFTTGQFVEISIPGLGEAPFTPSSRPSVKDTMEVTIMKVGKVTDKVHLLQRGDTIGVRGPLGKGYPVDDFKGKEILVVGGGVGFAPLRSLMYTLFERMADFKKVCFRGGSRTSDEIVYKKEITEVWSKRRDLDLKLTVDKGDSKWDGNVGLVTTILDAKINYASSIAIVCGPPIMMKFATLKLLEIGFKDENIYLSMEKNMSCGFGKCGHCRVGTYYACKDGPVFTYDKIKNFAEIWD